MKNSSYGNITKYSFTPGQEKKNITQLVKC